MKHLDRTHCVAFTDTKYFGLAAKRNHRELAGSIQPFSDFTMLSRSRGEQEATQILASLSDPRPGRVLFFYIYVSSEFSDGLTQETEFFFYIWN